VNTTAENAEVPHLKMLKVDADKTFSASPPDLEKPLESDGLLEGHLFFLTREGNFVIGFCYIIPFESLLLQIKGFGFDEERR